MGRHARLAVVVSTWVGIHGCGSCEEAPAATTGVTTAATSAPTEPTPPAHEPVGAPQILVDGEPLHPHCVIAAIEENAVDVDECARAPGELRMEGDRRVFLLEATDEWEEGGLEEYAVLGTFEGGWAIDYVWNGGGTGYFTGVAVLDVDGSRVRCRSKLATGDRCDGGITHAELTHDATGQGFLVTLNLVPPTLFDLTEAGRAVRPGVAAALESSALSCAATATYRWDGEEETLLHVDLAEEPLRDEEGWTEEYEYQSCFNALVDERIASGARRMGSADLDGFIEAFVARCVRSAGSPNRTR